MLCDDGLDRVDHLIRGNSRFFAQIRDSSRLQPDLGDRRLQLFELRVEFDRFIDQPWIFLH